MSSSRSSISNSNSKSNLSELSNKDPLSRFGAEVRGYAMAAVILEEWLQELAAIAQEQSVCIRFSMYQIRFHRNKSKKYLVQDRENTNKILLFIKYDSKNHNL